MDFHHIQARALEIRQAYLQKDEKKGRKPWTREHIAQALMGDVGDLMKIIQAKEGYREMKDIDEKLAHELSDCLWVICVLASEYGIDLEKSFLTTMDELKKKIDSNP